VDGALFAQRFSTLAPGLAIEGIEDADMATRAAGAILEHRYALPWLVIDATAAGYPSTEAIAALTRTTDASHLAAGFVTALSLLVAPSGLSEIATARHPAAHTTKDHPSHQLDPETGDHLLAAAAGFLAKDTEAVLTHLATNADPGGDLTAAFWHSLVARGDAESIANIVDGLRGGAEVDLARFAARGTRPEYQYPHARNLAFVAATLNRGFTKSATDAQGDIAAIGRIAGVASTVAGLVTGGSAVAESLVGTGAGWTIEGHANSVNAGIERQLETLIDTATSRLRPGEGVDLSQSPGAGNALLAWTSVYTRLLPHA
jgi:hypothetical protein